ncbi:MAG: hypothetical protein LBI53_01205 [Candidatus Peribacteria bacterium]|jgi:hypothetical protein|nr:hypothetical protein [Candidatus Peribacteria bacterium]
MAVKKSETKKPAVKKPIMVKTEKKAVTVTKKIIPPKVIVETRTTNPTHKNTCCRCTGNIPRKILILLILLCNVIVTILCYKALKQQNNFQILENGGKENHRMLKEVYNTPEFQKASTIGIYQLIERINQTLTTQN